jgi:hypothetical protein
MIYLIHHPAGNVVIRTTIPYIVLSYQSRGWLTTTSWTDLLSAHPEWRDSPRDSPAPTPRANAAQPRMFARVCAAILVSLDGTLAFAPMRRATRGATTARLIAAQDVDDDDEGEDKIEEEPISNAAPIHHLTAIPRTWYQQRGYRTPVSSWTLCTEGDEAFDYRLEDGVWELENVPGYEEEGGVRDAGWVM